MFRLFLIQLSVLLLITGSICNAETIVRLSIQQGTVVENVDLKLFDEDKPVTVNNFMNYVDEAKFDNSMIHRSIPGFIIQGGGYAFDPDNTDFSTSSFKIPDNGTIQNEPGISNLRGTIAMARPAGQIDGATSEWFINLDDANSFNLFPADGGADAYTVFGEVINNGMQVIDGIAGLPTFDLGSPFTDIPLVDYNSGAVSTSNLATITKVEGLLRISADLDYGTVTPQSNLQPEFVIENISDQNILIGNIADTNPVETPFRILSLLCDNLILLPGEKCAFVVVFNSPKDVAPATYTDSFNIEFPELGLHYTVDLIGKGGPDIDEPDISQVSSSSGFRSTDFGEVDVDTSETPSPEFIGLSYQNRGNSDLQITSIDLVTSQPDEFSISGSCLDDNVFEVGEFCTLFIEFVPLTIGEKNATLNIISDDPDEGIFDFTFNATVVVENDGVSDLIEDAGPNNGDGNYDGILDSNQSNVVSLPGDNGQYITLVGESGIRFRDVNFVDQSTLPTVPVNVATSLGILEFTVADLGADESLQVGMLLPASLEPASYYVFGPEVTDDQPDWFEFNVDNISATGSQIVTDGALVTSDGSSVNGTFVTLFLTNAVRGDSSFNVDNEINVIGAFNIPPSDNSSGQLYLLELCLFFSFIFVSRLKYHNKITC